MTPTIPTTPTNNKAPTTATPTKDQAKATTPTTQTIGARSSQTKEKWLCTIDFF
jgi:hypothetical protein